MKTSTEVKFDNIIKQGFHEILKPKGFKKKGNNFYLKLKGEVEEAVKGIGLKSLHIMRPSFLLGQRKEFRIGELIGKPMMKLFAFAIPAKYRAIHAKDVAKAMTAIAKRNEEGIFVYEYNELRELADQ